MKYRDEGGFSLGEAECLRDSGKAILVRIDGVGEEWIPQSQIHSDSEVFADGQKGELVVRTWFAEERGWV